MFVQDTLTNHTTNKKPTICPTNRWRHYHYWRLWFWMNQSLNPFWRLNKHFFDIFSKFQFLTLFLKKSRISHLSGNDVINCVHLPNYYHGKFLNNIIRHHRIPLNVTFLTRFCHLWHWLDVDWFKQSVFKWDDQFSSSSNLISS